MQASNVSLFSDTDVSRGSSATLLRCGGIVNDDFVACLLVNLSVKKIWKSVNIWRSYGQYCSALFFWLTVYKPLHNFMTRLSSVLTPSWFTLSHNLPQAYSVITGLQSHHRSTVSSQAYSLTAPSRVARLIHFLHVSFSVHLLLCLRSIFRFVFVTSFLVYSVYDFNIKPGIQRVQACTR